jgi:hypothetical protein
VVDALLNVIDAVLEAVRQSVDVEERDLVTDPVREPVLQTLLLRVPVAAAETVLRLLVIDLVGVLIGVEELDKVILIVGVLES